MPAVRRPSFPGLSRVLFEPERPLFQEKALSDLVENSLLCFAVKGSRRLVDSVVDGFFCISRRNRWRRGNGQGRRRYW